MSIAPEKLIPDHLKELHELINEATTILNKKNRCHLVIMETEDGTLVSSKNSSYTFLEEAIMSLFNEFPRAEKLVVLMKLVDLLNMPPEIEFEFRK